MAAERITNIEERIKQKQKESIITKAATAGNWLSVVTMTGAILFASPVALGIDILGTVAGNEIKDRNDRRIASQERGRLRVVKNSRMAKVENFASGNENTQPIPLKKAA